MSGGKRSLRYSTEAEMPAGMRTAYQAALAKLELPADVSRMMGVIEVVAQHPPCKQISEPITEAKISKNKYGAVPTIVDGIRFDSKREARYYEQLKLRKAAGEVLYFLRQVPIHLPGGTRLVVDFQEVHADGSLHYIDVKGRETAAFKIKRREVEHHYPFTIELA
jgi:hypothetical protein